MGCNNSELRVVDIMTGDYECSQEELMKWEKAFNEKHVSLELHCMNRILHKKRFEEEKKECLSLGYIMPETGGCFDLSSLPEYYTEITIYLPVIIYILENKEILYSLVKFLIGKILEQVTINNRSKKYSFKLKIHKSYDDRTSIAETTIKTQLSDESTEYITDKIIAALEPLVNGKSKI